MNIYQQTLIKYWGHSSFRPLQEDIIRSAAEGNDTLALLPTGGGKSITFQIPALIKEGICIVITPLIALMKDQVEGLRKKGIKAVAVYSGMTKAEIDITLDNCIYGDFKFLYVSPERLSTDIFKARVKKMNVNLIAVDEAHCISQWGYDFRPSYLKIADVRNLLPATPLLALTATATPKVVDDIQEKLVFKKKNVKQKSFERKNLIYLVREVEDKEKYLLKILSKTTGSGIVYVRNRKKTKEIAKLLIENNVRADYYHAGLSTEMRSLKQDEWKTNKTRIIVSTNAFGMGIDKPDVQIVVHMDLPDAVEAYFQEAGRAGRDEKRAYAVLLYNNTDKVSAEKRTKVNFPEIEKIKTIYQALGNYLKIPIGGGAFMEYDFHIADFASSFKFDILSIYNSIKVLEREGYLELTDEIDKPTKIHFQVTRDDLYRFQVENKSFDGFIKLVLRSYTGLFSDYVPIDEYMLAKRSGLSLDDIYNYLKRLQAMKVIKYIPKRKTPLIVYTTERLDEKNLRISNKNYKERKDRYIERITAMLDYCTHNTKCRSQQLLQYFGETNTSRCGKCDVCQRRNELELSKYDFDLILKDLKSVLIQQELFLDDLVNSVHYNENKTIKVIQWLLDNEKIIRGKNNKYAWHKE